LSPQAIFNILSSVNPRWLNSITGDNFDRKHPRRLLNLKIKSDWVDEYPPVQKVLWDWLNFQRVTIPRHEACQKIFVTVSNCGIYRFEPRHVILSFSFSAGCFLSFMYWMHIRKFSYSGYSSIHKLIQPWSATFPQIVQWILFSNFETFLSLNPS